MCGKCASTRAGQTGLAITIDWSRIPAGLDEVRRIPSGSIWAGPGFRVMGATGRARYERVNLVEAHWYENASVLETRPEVRKNYVVLAPRVLPMFLHGVTRKEVEQSVATAGYSDNFTVHELVEVAACKEVQVTKTETQLIWS